jgi:hypothetical protein
MLPLSNEELLEALVALSSDESGEIRAAAQATIDTLDPNSFIAMAADAATSADALAFLCLWPRASEGIIEAAVFNRSTPDAALAFAARRSTNSHIIEVISLKQQSLIRAPEIIEAILANPSRTPEAERRAREVRQEFFEKQYGAQMVADEQRIRAEAEAAARATLTVESIEDLIRLGLIEEGIDDSVIAEYEAEFGPFELVAPEPEEAINVEQVISELAEEKIVYAEEAIAFTADRVPVFQQIALMSVKDRVMLGIKGTREARMILVRDPNRIVACAVLRNPRLTETEVEGIASIRSLHEDVLRQIGMNRGWTRSYGVISSLVRNPRTPIAISLGFLNRILTRDMRALSLNKNIPDVIRQAALRLYVKRNSAGA